MKRKIICSLTILLMIILFGGVDSAYAMQTDMGRPDPTPSPRRILRPIRPKRPIMKSGPRSTRIRRNPIPESIAECTAGEIVARCGMPGCEVYVDGGSQGLTDSSGELRIPAESGEYSVRVTKPGYESIPAQKEVNVPCGGAGPFDVKLKAQRITLRIHTNLPNCELFINNQPTPIGRSNEQGLYNYTATSPELLIEARKPGYLSANRRITVTPESAQKEIALTLKPIPAKLNLSSDVEGARAQIDNQSSYSNLSEPISLSPGPHQITVDALGYSPTTFELTMGPGETVKKSVSLQRMPISQLIAQAEAFSRERAYENVLILCQYVFEVEPAHPAAHRLAGSVYLTRQDFVKAESYFARALAGNELVTLRIRRHPREEFDLNKGHDLCEAVLILGKSEVEFRGLRAPADNFKVSYSQIQVIGMQLKKNVAVYLSNKVTDVRGKRQDFNFYSFDKELTQSGKAYLEMLQRLLRAH